MDIHSVAASAGHHASGSAGDAGHAGLAATPAGATTEELTAWGKPMTIDTGFHSAPNDPTPSLATIRAELTAAYPPVGPIYA
jgi:hypothetical protein